MRRYHYTDTACKLEHTQPFRPIIEDDTIKAIKVRDLNADFTCPVCLGILQDTMTVMECLHRFCEPCIEMSLRHGKKECPSCRTSCPSKRNLRRDPAFDDLISRVYPDIKKVENEEEKVVSDIIKGHNSSIFAQAVEKGRQKQAVFRRSRVTLREDDVDPAIFLEEIRQQAITRPNIPPKREEKNIDVCLIPTTEHPSNLMLSAPTFIRCPKTITVGSLLSYVQKRSETESVIVFAAKGVIRTSKDGIVELTDSDVPFELRKKYPEVARNGVYMLFYELGINPAKRQRR
mmetsp:Transcript_29026/g.70798  ORF Transcript_29026/g.70798 Transcript_29026/m.70798 type:complete len:289 (-) Transcript_29026:173-1039(-)|eukprot:CAMPEP_0114495658 /NCGR_PEP_ID=MMETSP0109-20121206/5333_1 /TAXON_ID=29199 /ORGANISM="Chlorarachnion reptans, Strain CCCM449" /LENGTH=288 /DNA_ID=CAMNT_0001672837 /DNA_START=215 /DNA_END=1081 /DNA_ORIENTATION=+